jgi:hypothetical protein
MLMLDIFLGGRSKNKCKQQNYVLQLELRKSLVSFIARVSSIAAGST